MKLYGKNPVIERLKTNPRSIRKIYLEAGHADAGYVYKKAKKWGIPVIPVPKGKLHKLARNVNTQGLLVEIEEFLYTPYDELLAAALKDRETLFFLDGLNDPQNLGAMIRSLAALGKFSIVLPSHNSVGITETVLRIACGGENYLQVAKVRNLSQAISAAKAAGFWIAGTVVKNGQDLSTTTLPFPLAMVIGSEQKGIRDVLHKQLDIALTIPMAADRLSLNAAHAVSIVAYEVMRQKGQRPRKQ